MGSASRRLSLSAPKARGCGHSQEGSSRGHCDRLERRWVGEEPSLIAAPSFSTAKCVRPPPQMIPSERCEPEPRRRFSATQSRARAAFGSRGIFVSATSQLLQEGRHNRQPQTSQPAAWEFNTQLDLLAARAVKLVSAAAEKAAVFSSPVSSLGCIRLFSGNFAVGVNLLDLDLSNIHL